MVTRHSSIFKLKRTPIKEIVLSISFEETLEINVLDRFKASAKITKDFTSIRPGFNTHVTAKLSEPPVANVSLDGYILRSKNSHNVIQVRKGAISFHRTNGYEEFDSMLDGLKGIWNVLLEEVNQLTVNNIGVRYLNTIEKEKTQNITDIIQISLNHPFENFVNDQLIVVKYLNNASSITGNITIATQKSKEEQSVILDINLSKTILGDKKFSFDMFYELREAKNDIFFKTITEKTKQKYNS